ncbi:LysR substrate-binding domain-containing protein [Lacibacterium aquatile]|uniref:LysR substrate-binding domain-containing protein n=1 Tax=Lacibacterium aquatile TaxID=1168082 RepID=A0ABW5DUD9_9PROT
MRRLPPFAPLVAFEAVARLGSFTAAAAELLLTQSAISHRVRLLESHMDAKLFERLNPGLALTPAGRSLLGELSPLLEGLQRLQPPARMPKSPLRLGASAAVISWWLARRLPSFAKQHPDIALEIVPFVDLRQAQETEVDLRLMWELESTVTDRDDQLILPRDSVFPVCHPRLAGTAPLKDLPLIHKGSVESDFDRGREWNWDSWLEQNDLPPPSLKYRDMGSALAAAAEGAGVALGRSLLVQDALDEGRLVRVLPASASLPSSKVHVVRWYGDPRGPLVARWLVDEARSTLAREDTQADLTLARNS